MIKKILLIIALLVLLLSGLQIIPAFFENHTYYKIFFLDLWNRGVILSWLILSCLPVWYMFSRGKNKTLSVFMWLVFFALWIFCMLYIGIQSTFRGWWFNLFIHLLFLVVLISYFLTSLFAWWSYIYKIIFDENPSNIFHILLSLGCWLIVFLLINQLLILTGLFHPIASRIIFTIWWVLIWKQKSVLLDTQKTIFSLTKFDSWQEIYRSIAIFLMILCVLYFFILIFQSYIPYSTAWDANHAYMFYPKMWAANYGYYWHEWGMTTTPHIWYAYISYWFSLFIPFWWFRNISEDTIAIVMNALSGMFVLIFGTGLIAEMLSIQEDEKSWWSRGISYYVPLYIGIWLLLAWLTSGMWAFLVFVDNKTDLWVMSLVIMWLYSWFVFIKLLLQSIKNKKFERNTTTKRMWIVSWVFFAVAWLAKPTALFDVVTFTWLLWILVVWFFWWLAIILLVLWLTSAIEFRWIKDYIGSEIWRYLLGVGTVVWLSDIYRWWIKKLLYVWYILLYRWWWFLWVFILMKSLYRVPYYTYNHIEIEPVKFMERLFFSDASQNQNYVFDDLLLLADVGNSVPLDSCSLQWLGYDSTDLLYDNLWEIAGTSYDEDVGRYIWYGWKWKPADQKKMILPYTNPWWWFLFRPGCVWVFRDKEAGEICRTEYDSNPAIVPIDIQTRTINTVIDSVGNKIIYFPYKYLVLQNITYNWSLKNASSYYTDIWYIWLILITMLPLWLILGIYRNDKLLTWLCLMTLWWWGIWFFIWWGILWYGIWIIVWTILSLVAILQQLIYISAEDDESKLSFRVVYIFLSVVVIYIVFQVLPNMLRVVSLWSNAIGDAYKTNTLYQSQITDSGTRQLVKTTPFTKTEAFDLQFWHYRPFINTMSIREEGEWAVIAWTYARYFINNQEDIRYDQFLTWFQKHISDNDVCKSYLRMKDKDIKYIALDPNIGTVVQWEWNISLFHRFFAEVVDNTIVADGAVSMITKLVRDGYAQLHSTNNIGAKYALNLPEESYINLGETEDERLLLRSRLVVSRYYQNNNPALLDVLTQIALQRIDNGLFIDDLADIYGKTIDVDLVKSRIPQWQTVSALVNLTYEERSILDQYFQLAKRIKSDPDWAEASIKKLIEFSINSSNQILVLEIK